ncbi:hypothetical protein AZI86_15920 [Bdellovibrio bacteriovorus]|uniref:Uncharacterized protein n=1 Tax=Bdellovibrio bacteriovorus TaxID=959 RepID=A0A150WI72_BDEBC|nr:hypothetical protein [Bdellovibrio bacteriovorus]KYG63189.1 hypothetical protein AZI86_15920 [Bdellovibrio bacteriovorus]
MSWAGWFSLILCGIGAFLMAVAKFRQKGAKEMAASEMKVFLRGYFLFLIGACLSIVLGLTYCMPYFT